MKRNEDLVAGALFTGATCMQLRPARARGKRNDRADSVV
jgi:hypothetical protein